ncbi:MAG: hypothetical protein KGL39_47570 [Patescibacteria group bacterium]|nr:hypothetical protein [Patescibacteria group bacterium]
METHADAPRELTPRQKAVCQAIRTHQQLYGRPPSLAELAAALGVRSRNSVRDHLVAIQKKGYLEITPHLSRGVRLIEPAATKPAA